MPPQAGPTRHIWRRLARAAGTPPACEATLHSLRRQHQRDEIAMHVIRNTARRGTFRGGRTFSPHPVSLALRTAAKSDACCHRARPWFFQCLYASRARQQSAEGRVRGARESPRHVWECRRDYLPSPSRATPSCAWPARAPVAKARLSQISSMRAECAWGAGRAGGEQRAIVASPIRHPRRRFRIARNKHCAIFARQGREIWPGLV